MIGLFLLALLPLFGQAPVPGSSRTGAAFDPRQPRPPASAAPADPIFLRRRPILQTDPGGVRPRLPDTIAPPAIAFSRPGTSLQQALQDQPTIQFEGISDQVYQPPSPNIAAGPEDLLVVVNSSLARYPRGGGIATDSLTLKQWFSALLPTVCSSGITCLIADPGIHYDQLHGRFLFTAQAYDDYAGTSYILLSVSRGTTWAGGFTHWALDAHGDGIARASDNADFPQLGFDADAVYVSMLMFNSAGVYTYTKLRIVRMADLLNPFTTDLQWRDLPDLRNEDGTRASTVQPVHVRGRTKVGPGGFYLVCASDTFLAPYYTLFRVDDGAGNPKITRFTLKGIWNYAWPLAAAQLDSFLYMDTGQSSFLKAVSRDGVIYAAQNARLVDDPSTVVYTRIDTATLEVTNQAKWTNGTFFYPAFDVPASHGRANTFPNKLIAGSTTDSQGNLTYAGLFGVKAGEGVFEAIAGVGVRWGDYFGATIDPINGGLWVSGQYAKRRAGARGGLYGVTNAYFPWTTAQQFDDVSITNPNFHNINVLRQWNISHGCSATSYCPETTITKVQFTVLLIRSIFGDNFPFTPRQTFSDVPDGDPFYPYVQKAIEIGIVSSCSATQFCPQLQVTRSEVAGAIVKAKFYNLPDSALAAPTVPYFQDVPFTDPNYRYIQKMRELGITSGCAQGQFCPSRQLTRSELSVFLVRAFLN